MRKMMKYDKFMQPVITIILKMNITLKNYLNSKLIVLECALRILGNINN